VDISDPTQPRIAGTYTDTTLLNRIVGVDLDPSHQYAIELVVPDRSEHRRSCTKGRDSQHFRWLRAFD